MSTFEVVRGAEGDCLLLDDTRISGPKPWGGGTVTKTFQTDEAFVVVPKDELDKLKAENAELVRVLHELEKEAVHAYRCLQHDCEQVLESEQHFFKKWWSSDCENDTLRELAREADRIMQGVLDNATDTVTVSDLPCCDTLFDRLVEYRLKMRRLGLELSDAQLKELRELGIEVDA